MTHLSQIDRASALAANTATAVNAAAAANGAAAAGYTAGHNDAAAAAVSSAVITVTSSWKTQTIHETEITFKTRMILHEISRNRCEIDYSLLLEKMEALRSSILGIQHYGSEIESLGLMMVEVSANRGENRVNTVAAARAATRRQEAVHNLCLTIMGKELHTIVKEILLDMRRLLEALTLRTDTAGMESPDLTPIARNVVLRLKEIYAGSILDLPIPSGSHDIPILKTLGEYFNKVPVLKAILDQLELSQFEKDRLIFLIYFLTPENPSKERGRVRLSLIDNLLEKGAHFSEFHRFKIETSSYFSEIAESYLAGERHFSANDLEKIMFCGYGVMANDYDKNFFDSMFHNHLYFLDSERYGENLQTIYECAIDYGANPSIMFRDDKLRGAEESFLMKENYKAEGDRKIVELVDGRYVLPKDVKEREFKLIHRWLIIGIYKRALANLERAASYVPSDSSRADGRVCTEGRIETASGAAAAAAAAGAAGAAADNPVKQDSAQQESRQISPLMQVMRQAIAAMPTEILALIAYGYCPPPEKEVLVEVKKLREQKARAEAMASRRADGVAAAAGGGVKPLK